jgi:hypothetical protein
MASQNSTLIPHKSAINLIHNWTNEDIYIALLMGYTPDPDIDDLFSTIQGSEITATSYPEGGIQLTNKTLDTSVSGQVKLRANNVQFTDAAGDDSIIASAAVIYSHESGIILGTYEFGENAVADDGTLTFDFSNGILIVDY